MDIQAGVIREGAEEQEEGGRSWGGGAYKNKGNRNIRMRRLKLDVNEWVCVQNENTH